LALKVLSKSMDSTSLSSDKVEMSVVKYDQDKNQVYFSYVSEQEIEPLTKEVTEEAAEKKD
jgi:hypothetical protein